MQARLQGIGKCGMLEKINTQANATVIELIDYATRRNYPGVVIKIKRGGKFNALLYCFVIFAGLQVASRCYRRQLNDFTLEQLEIGQLVTVSVASVPQDCLVDEAYVLPPQTEFKIGSEEVLRIGMGVIGTVGAHSPWPYRRDGKTSSILLRLKCHMRRLSWLKVS